MTFLELHELLKPLVWPEGIARNLLRQYRMDLQTAMVDLQQNVKMLQQGNPEKVDFGATFWKCGATYVSIPPLAILNAVEIHGDDDDEDEEPNECCVIKALAISQRQMECKFERCADLVLPDSDPDEDGFFGPDPELDPATPPTSYYASIINLKLVIYPAIPSTTYVRYVYSGVKRNWEDIDELPDLWVFDDEIDSEIADYLTWYLRSIKDRCDPTKYALDQSRLIDRRQKMMSDRVRDERARLNLPEPCFPCHR